MPLFLFHSSGVPLGDQKEQNGPSALLLCSDLQSSAGLWTEAALLQPYRNDFLYQPQNSKAPFMILLDDFESFCFIKWLNYSSVMVGIWCFKELYIISCTTKCALINILLVGSHNGTKPKES